MDELFEENERNQTIIVVTQRLSTLKNADMIAVLSQGKIVETGKHSELVSRRGVYYSLVEAQKEQEREGSGAIWNSSKRYGAASISAALGLANSTNTVDPDDVITFEEVSFKYPSRPEEIVFQGLQLSLKKGENLSIVGPW